MRWSRKATSSASTFLTRATHSRSIFSFEMRGTGFPAMRGSTTDMVFSLISCRLALAPARSDILQLQHLGGLGAHAPAERRAVDDRLAVGWDHLLELGGPRLELAGKAALENLDRDPHGRGCAGGSAQQRDQRAVGRRHQFRSEFEHAGAPGIRLDDLHALSRHLEPPVLRTRPRVVALQGGEPLLRGQQQLTDQIFGEIEVVAGDREQWPDIARPDGEKKIEQRAVLQEFRREARVWSEQERVLSADDARIE